MSNPTTIDKLLEKIIELSKQNGELTNQLNCTSLVDAMLEHDICVDAAYNEDTEEVMYWFAYAAYSESMEVSDCDSPEKAIKAWLGKYT